MKTIKILIFIAFASILLNSCKYECPGFDKSLLVWMPKEYGDEIKFTNNDNSDTLVFTVNNKEYTDSYMTERQNKKSCDAVASLGAKNNFSNSNFYISIYNPYNSDIGISIYIYLIEEQLEKTGEQSISFTNINEIKEPIVINNKTYNAIIIENDTLINQNEIYKIILAENYGLLKFYEKSGIEWTLEK